MGNVQLFESKQIRSYWNEEEQKWYFAVVDVVDVLTDSARPRKYWADLKKKLVEEGYVEVSEKIGQLKMVAQDGKMRLTDVADMETLLRIIQSIPSPKAEPFKRWLAQVGYERIEEVENPELAVERMKELYRAKGYDEDWIEKRLQSIVVRNQLTDEWQQRGVSPGKEYGVLTSVISVHTFDVTPNEHKNRKGLKKENLRDHMTPLELVFTMLGEASTTEITRRSDAQGFEQNQVAARTGGEVAGNARRELEAKTGVPVVSRQNYLPSSTKKKLDNSNKEKSNLDEPPF